MAANQAIEYAPQCGDLTVESLVFHNNNVMVLSDEGKNPLILDYKTLVESTRLDYAKGTYVSHPSPEAMKAKLAKIVLDGNYSSTEQVNSIQQLITYCLLIRTQVDIGEIIYSDLDEKLGSPPAILSNSNFSKDPSKVTLIELTASMIAGPEASEAISKKRKKPKSKKPTPKTQVTPSSVPTEDFKKTQSVSLGQTAHPQDTERNIQPTVKGFHSPLDEGTRKSQPLPEGTTTDPKDSGGNVQPADKELPSTVSNEGTVKTTPLPEGPHGDKGSKGFKPPANMEPLTTHVADPSRTDAKYQVDQTQSTRLRYRSLTKNKGETSSELEPDNQTLLLSTAVDVQALLLSDEELMKESEDDPESSHAQNIESDSDSSCLEALNKYDNIYRRSVGKHEEVVASYADLKSEIKGFHDVSYKVHKGTKAAFSTYEKLLVKFQARYGKDAEKILGSLKVIQDAVKEDPALNKKVIEAIETYTKNSTNLTELLSLIKSFNFHGLKSSVESLQASALRQDEHLAEWAKSSTSMAWNLGPRLTSIESTQVALRSEISFLKQDTSEIKSIITEIFIAFKGQSSLAPSSSVPTTTLAITEEPAIPISTVKPITRTNPEIALIESSSRPSLADTILEIPIPQPTGPVIDLTPPEQPKSPPVVPKANKGKGVAIEEPTMKLVPASKEVYQDPNELIRVPYETHGKTYQITNDEIQAHMDKEEKIKKAAEEAKLSAMSKPELIKVVQEEASKEGVDPKIFSSAKGGH
ncbi:hypothetical protein Tco_1111203 [Tanacetum coccineum]|uniref:Uncharacterized protein n=1 Tax=Tanacetum coccineum TaxID=301880 RepID=A0ABQ5IME8_9ASTR